MFFSRQSTESKLNRAIFLHKITAGYLHFIIYLIPLVVFIAILNYYILTRYKNLVPTLLENILPAIFTFILMLVLTPLCIKVARHFKIQVNHKDHKKHFAPTPLLGGLAVYVSFVIVALLHQPWSPQMQAIMLASSIIAVMGTIDDIRPLSSIVRLLGQLIAAGIVMNAGLKITFMPSTWWGEIGAVLFTLIWILGIVNATNFVDGVDGLAAGFTVIASVFFFLITLHLDQFAVVLVASLLIGAGLGFLVFNFKPAKIYLGDGGSTFMGFVLACLALYGEWSSWGPIIAIGIPVLILGVLIFDMIYITISRVKNGQVHNFKEWLDYRGYDHFHHRLINLGFKEEEAVIFIYAICIILGLSALVIEHARISFPVVVLLIQAILIFIAITLLMLVGREKTIHEKKP